MRLERPGRRRGHDKGWIGDLRSGEVARSGGNGAQRADGMMILAAARRFAEAPLHKATAQAATGHIPSLTRVTLRATRYRVSGLTRVSTCDTRKGRNMKMNTQRSTSETGDGGEQGCRRSAVLETAARRQSAVATRARLTTDRRRTGHSAPTAKRRRVAAVQTGRQKRKNYKTKPSFEGRNFHNARIPSRL